MRFLALDFETANPSRTSACAVGMVLFDGSASVDRYYSLIRPPKGFGWFNEDFTKVHHLTHLDVRQAQLFPAIAPAVFDRIASVGLVIAHWAAFDLSVLRALCDHFDLACPRFASLCTCTLARRVWPDLPDHHLDTVCNHLGHAFTHHHALEDAQAAGEVLLAATKQLGLASPEALVAERTRV